MDSPVDWEDIPLNPIASETAARYSRSTTPQLTLTSGHIKGGFTCGSKKMARRRRFLRAYGQESTYGITS
ncbi:hypothetical protein PGTUg99_022558 [Puccinia graminis f. sp. tritici]|uniref:Uncharacterized protein n=1 Tax=Puccinia graminis f. sp. tritici TaxID=56615 RepID=A0A5B0NH82_PUCGR|nr:hypothetical protein PGTUg99_022558 [Puccinia graminis f. sp. tritici]